LKLELKKIRKPDNGADPTAVRLLLLLQELNKSYAIKIEHIYLYRLFKKGH
jgi:hypothetical protein